MRYLIVYIIVCIILLSLYSNYLKKSLEIEEEEKDGNLAAAREYHDMMRDKDMTCSCKQEPPKSKTEEKPKTGTKKKASAKPKDGTKKNTKK